MRRSFALPAALAIAIAPNAAAFAQAVSPYATFVQGSRPDTAQLAGFSVALVMGSQAGDLTPDGLPAAAAKALADLKDFLPYKSYQLLDTQWTIGNRAFASRLRGPEGKEFSLEMQAGAVAASKIAVTNFGLREGGTEPAPFAERDIERSRLLALHERRAELEAQLTDLRRTNPGNSRVPTLERQLKDVALAEVNAQKASEPGGLIISTSFTMDVGETVVVGTSRLQGDKALIVLLTAVSKKPAAAGGVGGGR